MLLSLSNLYITKFSGCHGNSFLLKFDSKLLNLGEKKSKRENQLTRKVRRKSISTPRKKSAKPGNPLHQILVQAAQIQVTMMMVLNQL